MGRLDRRSVGGLLASLVLLSCKQPPQDASKSNEVKTPDPAAQIGVSLGTVRDSARAVQLADSILATVYGRSVIAGELPLVATSKDEVWTIKGTLPKGHVGGVAEIDIDGATGRILRITHSY